ncbi:MAG: 50S ribosomal protein L6, partial [Candidatus Anstonellales archaeon]
MVKEYLARKEVEIPDEVKIEINGLKVRAIGPKGELEKDFTHAKNITIRFEDGKIVVEKYFPSKEEKALVGT